MSLDDITRLLSLGLALAAWARAYARPNVSSIAAALVATMPLLDDA